MKIENDRSVFQPRIPWELAEHPEVFFWGGDSGVNIWRTIGLQRMHLLIDKMHVYYHMIRLPAFPLIPNIFFLAENPMQKLHK